MGPILLLLSESEELMCSEKFISSSPILSDMVHYSTENSDPIRVPEFISKNSMLHVMKLVEIPCVNAKDIQNYSTEFLIELFSIADFFLIETVVKKFQVSLLSRITPSTCYNIYNLTLNRLFLNTVCVKAKNEIIEELEKQFGTKMFPAVIVDQSDENYSELCFESVKEIIIGSDKMSTVTKISFFKSWWNKNANSSLKDEVLILLEDINAKAIYIPKQQILYMRKIRDNIMQELL